jgi:hypothetical protein
METTSKEIGVDMPILQCTATLGNRYRRIVALEEVAGSSPVGHPPWNVQVCRCTGRKGGTLGVVHGFLLNSSTTT